MQCSDHHRSERLPVLLLEGNCQNQQVRTIHSIAFPEKTRQLKETDIK